MCLAPGLVCGLLSKQREKKEQPFRKVLLSEHLTASPKATPCSGPDLVTKSRKDNHQMGITPQSMHTGWHCLALSLAAALRKPRLCFRLPHTARLLACALMRGLQKSDQAEIFCRHCQLAACCRPSMGSGHCLRCNPNCPGLSPFSPPFIWYPRSDCFLPAAGFMGLISLLCLETITSISTSASACQSFRRAGNPASSYPRLLHH